MRPRPEPSDIAAARVPRMGENPAARRRWPILSMFAQAVPGAAKAQAGIAAASPDPRAQEEADAREQDAIAKAVEGVLP